MSMPTPTDKLLSTLGLCARARRLVIGTPMVCDALREVLRAGGRSSVLAVIEASDTSENTHEKLVSKCSYYSTPLYRIPADTARLGHAIGKSGLVAAVGVTDEQLFHALERYLPTPVPLPARQDIPVTDTD